MAWLLVASIGGGRTFSAWLAGGLVAVFVVLAVLIWTRLGQARPITKCVFLSLLAHLLLLIYAYSTHILFGPPGKWYGQTVTIRLHDADEWDQAAPAAAVDPPPWEQPGEPESPLAAAPAQADNQAAFAAPSEPTGSTAPPLLAAEQPPVEAMPPSPSAEQAPTAAPREGLPDEARLPEAEMPRLTDLLPDGTEPRSETTATDSQPMAADGQTADDAPPTPLTPAADSEPAVPEASPPGEQFVAVTPPPVPRRLGDGQLVPEPLRARVAADRLRAAQPFGATPKTEAAVAAALDWLASVQSTDGRWDADAHAGGRETRVLLGHDRRGAGAQADTGASGLALLAFLGAGQTHLAGKHRETVQHGLEFLLASQSSSGNLAGNAEFFAAMYCHGIATLALSEAYALSGDERLLPGLKAALAYTIGSQHAGGGWRYQPHDEGDMSQFGWQLMALKSAELGGIPIPAATRERMIRFLQNCSSGKSRGLAAYRPRDRASRPMTAEALVCRYFLAAENSPAALDEAAAYVLQEQPGTGTANFYYWYYGTLAMFQRQGDDWPRWNAALQAELLGRQRWDGGLAGSWDPDDLWGGCGGRIYSTALAALSLEVYYRYLPLHGHDAESRLTDRPWLPAVPR